MNVVIDTNVLISSLFGKSIANLGKLIPAKNIQIVISDEQFREIFDVLQRPKIRGSIKQEEILRLLITLGRFSKIVKIENEITDCRDLKDNFLLETALKGKAQFIVTGDQDLLVMNPYKGIKIIKYNEFEQIIK